MKPSSMPKPERMTGTNAIFCETSSPTVSLIGVDTGLQKFGLFLCPEDVQESSTITKSGGTVTPSEDLP